MYIHFIHIHSSIIHRSIYLYMHIFICSLCMDWYRYIIVCADHTFVHVRRIARNSSFPAVNVFFSGPGRFAAAYRCHPQYPIYVRFNPSMESHLDLYYDRFLGFMSLWHLKNLFSKPKRKACSQTASMQSPHRRATVTYLGSTLSSRIRCWATGPPPPQWPVVVSSGKFFGVKLSRKWLDKENKELADSWWIPTYSTWGV